MGDPNKVVGNRCWMMGGRESRTDDRVASWAWGLAVFFCLVAAGMVVTSAIRYIYLGNF